MKMKMNCLSLGLILVAPMASAALTAHTWKEHPWKRKVDIGASIASGNTETTLVTAGFRADRKLEKDVYSLGFTSSWGEEDGETTSQSVLADASWHYARTDRTYFGFRLDGRHDNLADIDYRVSLSVLAGYFVINKEETILSVEGGPAITYEEVADVTDEYFTIYLGQKFEHQLREETKIYQNVEVFIRAEDFNDFNIILEAGLETKLSDVMDLKVSIENKYENEPAAGRTENDFRLITGLSYSF